MFLSNYRGSILESGVLWKKQVQNRAIDEIYFPIELFDYTRILDVFKRHSFLSIDEEQATKEIIELIENNFSFVKSPKTFFINNNNRKSLSSLEEELKKFIETIHIPYKIPEKKSKFSQFKVPPPKPKPKDFT